jgi:hypothetical protein
MRGNTLKENVDKEELEVAENVDLVDWFLAIDGCLA